MAALIVLASGCRPRLEAQLELGRAAYQQRCAACHEGANHIGPALTATVLGGYGTATRLFDYVSSMMPQDAPGSLPPVEYWAIVAFLLRSTGKLGEGSALGAETADRVLLGR